jgi:hypothetical protein
MPRFSCGRAVKSGIVDIITPVSDCIMGPPMMRQIRASADELEHAIIVIADVMSEEEKSFG